MKELHLIIPLIFVILLVKMMKIDNMDKTLPFGTDIHKNNKYAKGKSGEEYGVQTFWGRPRNKDDARNCIDKIQWLSGGFQKDVMWRRSLIFAVVFTIVIIICTDINLFFRPGYFVLLVCLLFIAIYASHTYYTRHFLNKRVLFINTHIRKLKDQMNIPQYNRINELSII